MYISSSNCKKSTRDVEIPRKSVTEIATTKTKHIWMLSIYERAKASPVATICNGEEIKSIQAEEPFLMFFHYPLNKHCFSVLLPRMSSSLTLKTESPCMSISKSLRLLFGPLGLKIFYLQPTARQISSLFRSNIYSGSLFFPLAYRAQLASALELAGHFCWLAAKYWQLCANFIFHMKEYFKNKLLVHVVIACTGRSEGNGKTLSLTLVYLKSVLDLQQIAGAALCHLLVVGSSGCEISLNQRALGLKPIPLGPTALAKLLPVTRTLAEPDTLFGPGSPPWWQPLLHFSASSRTLSSFPWWGPGSESFFSLRKKTSVLVYNFVFQGCRGSLLPLSQWGSPHQMSSQHEQTAAELALCALANKQQTQIMNSLKCSSTFRLTYFTQAQVNIE